MSYLSFMTGIIFGIGISLIVRKVLDIIKLEMNSTNNIEDNNRIIYVNRRLIEDFKIENSKKA